MSSHLRCHHILNTWPHTPKTEAVVRWEWAILTPMGRAPEWGEKLKDWSVSVQGGIGKERRTAKPGWELGYKEVKR